MQFDQIQFGRDSRAEFHLSIGNPGVDKDKLILVLPPGAQNKFEASVYEIWLDDFQKAGWSTIIPVAIGEKLFWQGSERVIRPIFQHVETREKLTGAVKAQLNQRAKTHKCAICW